MRVCLVTGSSRSFGRLICEHLAASGHRVNASMRRTSGPGADLAETCELLKLDVIDGDSVALAVQRIVDREGRLDAVVNNAGYVLWGPVEETRIEEIQREFDVNVFGALRVACAGAPVMRRQGSGVVVQISSISGRVVAGPFWGHYAASKFALEAFSEALAYELRPFGVRVVLVEPGSYDTTIGQSIQLSPGVPLSPRVASRTGTLRELPRAPKAGKAGREAVAPSSPTRRTLRPSGLARSARDRCEAAPCLLCPT